MHSITSAATKRKMTSPESRCYKHRSLIRIVGILKKKKNKLYLTPNRQMYNASHYHKITAIYTHAHTWTHVHRHSSYKQNNKLIITFGVGDFHKDNTVAIIEATYNIYFCLHLLFLCSVIYMISTSFEN